MGDAHKVVAPCHGQQTGQIFNVILVGLHVVGVTAVAAHGDAGELAHKMILEARTGHLTGVVQILRPDEAHHRVD